MPLDLEAGLRTRPEDVAALRRARDRKPVSLEYYLEFLRSQTTSSPADLRARRGPRGNLPFSFALLQRDSSPD